MRISGYEHLHLHSHYSLLDGIGFPDEYAARWKGHGDYLCVTDHGMMAAIPDQVKACDPTNKKDDPYRNKKLHALFGAELYVNPLQVGYDSPEEFKKYQDTLSPDELKRLRHKGNHLLAIAYTDEGYKNLVRLSSWAWTKGHYYRPRVNHEMLRRHREGIIFTSCCYASEIGMAFDQGGEDAGMAMIETYMAMFSPNFYLEIMLLDFVKQKPYDVFILKAAEKYGLKVILTQDVHYCNPEDSKFQHLSLMIQTGTTIKETERRLQDGDDVFVAQDPNLWMKTEEELNAKWESDYADVIDWEVFERAKLNTVEICRKAQGVQIDRSMKLPVIPDADDKLLEAAIQGLKKRGLYARREYQLRIKEEFALIKHKRFSSYFLIQKMMTDEARRVCPELLGWGDGSEAVGPGRGSCAGSLLCYCLGITDVDPIRHNLLFSRFLSEARGGRSVKLRFPAGMEEAA